MLEYFRKLLDSDSFAPHGYCLLWNPQLIWTHVVSDALIGVAYFSIPVVIAHFLTQRRDIAFSWIVWMFAIFIMACGMTHFLSIWTLWHPDYGIEALVKALTAAASVVTAVALWPLLPRAIAVPSPAMLQRVNGDLRLRIDERDEALAALERATAERERTEDLLRQSQKMEAVGQLTGGIAHDFNNLLTIVVGNLDRAQRLAATDPAVTKALGHARQGAERAAVLTQQLLAFSRKQPLRPEIHDVNALVRGMADLLERTIGDGIHIETRLEDGLWPVNVDANQTENALLNLVVNARDAMPGGGSLTIATYSRSDPGGDPGGDHVIVEVTDDGTGMDEDTVAQVFDPFFTTKAIGKGTGLGLSQVHGFISQSNGTIDIDSRPGEGTRVRIALPRAQIGVSA